MDYQEKSSLVRRITSRKFYGSINYNNKSYDVVFTDPSLSLNVEADWIYKKTYTDLKETTSIITLEESYQILTEQGKWNDKLETEFNGTREDIDNLIKGLNAIRFHKAETRAVKKTIEKAKKRLEELFLIKNQLRTSTVEFMAEKAKKRFIIKNIAKLINDSEVINNPLFKDSLVVYYFEESSISESKVRELARSDPWRLFWTTSKDTGTPLFPHSCVEMSELQQSLVSWTKLYDFAFQSSNRPTDDIIEDDDKFDAWYRAECERIDSETAKNQIEDQYKGNEVFIPADSEGAKEVYALNNDIDRAKLKVREKFIQERGEVKEQALPDVKQKLQMEINRMSTEAIKRR